jgi:NAD(P)-dependent dehydrogenase (short-subunit alcohol dehydrogenase family)
VSDGPGLVGQTLVVIGGSSGIGLETARRARDEGAEIIITGRNADRVHRAGLELGASIAAFDATDFDRLERFFDELRAPIDHLVVACPCPYNPPLTDFDVEAARRTIETQLLLPLQVARNARGKLRPGGTLLFNGCTGEHRSAACDSRVWGPSAALPELTKSLALEIAPIRVNLILAGFVDVLPSVALPSDRLVTHREQLRTTLPIRPVARSADTAALAVHLMSNTAVTGATFEIDGGQQLVHK